MSYGPFCRLESPTQTTTDALEQSRTGEVWGTEAKGLFLTVRAYRRALSTSERGVQFDTPVAPDRNTSAPHEAHWLYPQTSGVMFRQKNGIDYAAIPIGNFVNKQP